MPAFQHHVRFCRSRDGARIALATAGKGPAVVRAAHWLSHVEHDVTSPVWARWIQELARDHMLVRYDQRGCGLSDAAPPSMSFESWVEDLEAVVEAQGLKRFALFGMSQGAAIAIAYAARHPERVSRLVLLGGYARGLLRRPLNDQQREEAHILVKLIRLGWGRDNPAFRQVFTSQFIPDGTREQHQWFNDLERSTTSADNAARIVETMYGIDVTKEARRLRVPTLVMHCRRDARVSPEEGQLLAEMIPGARFVGLESRNHVLLEGEPAWTQFLSEYRAFMSEGAEGATALGDAGLTASEREVLGLLAKGLDNGEIARTLDKSEKTVRNQVSSIFSKLGTATRAQTVALARDAGLGTS